MNLHRPIRRLGRWMRHGRFRLFLYLSFALVLAACAMWGFAEVVDGLAEGEFRRLDRMLLQVLAARDLPQADRAARWITELGSWLVLSVLVVTNSVLLWRHRRRSDLVLLATATAGAAMLSLVLKPVFGRERPGGLTDYVQPESMAFPSGHALQAAAVYLALAWVLTRAAHGLPDTGRARGAAGDTGAEDPRGPAALRRPGALLRATVWTLALLTIALVGVSRVVLGVHYPTDVLGGWAVGVGWAMLCVVGVEAGRDLRARHG